MKIVLIFLLVLVGNAEAQYLKFLKDAMPENSVLPKLGTTLDEVRRYLTKGGYTFDSIMNDPIIDAEGKEEYTVKCYISAPFPLYGVNGYLIVTFIENKGAMCAWSGRYDFEENDDVEFLKYRSELGSREPLYRSITDMTSSNTIVEAKKIRDALSSIYGKPISKEEKKTHYKYMWGRWQGLSLFEGKLSYVNLVSKVSN